MHTSPRTLGWTLAEITVGVASTLAVGHAASWNGGAQVALAAALVLSASSLARPSISHLIAFAWLPPVLAVLLAAPEPVAALAGGTAALVATAAALLAGGRLSRGSAVILISAWCVAFRLVPLSGIPILEIIVVAAGCSALCLVLSRGEAPGAGHVAVAILAAALSLPAPADATLMPALLAAFVAAARSRHLVLAGLALVAALLAGKWIIPVAALAFLPWIRLPQRAEARLVPVWWSPGVATRAVLLHAAAWPLWARADWPARLLAAAFTGGAILIDRPWISAVWLLAAIVSLTMGLRHAAEAKPLAALALLVAAGVAWGGAIPGAFPLPGTLATTLAVGLALAAAVTLRQEVAAILGTLALGVLFLTVAEQRPAEARALEMELVEGQDLLLPVDSSNILTALTMRGANTSTLHPARAVAVLEVAAEGGGYRQTIAAGDVGDWGGLRDEHLFTTRLRGLPRGGRLLGLGREAFMQSEGSIDIRSLAGMNVVRIRRAPDLPDQVVLVVESAAMERR